MTPRCSQPEATSLPLATSLFPPISQPTQEDSVMATRRLRPVLVTVPACFGGLCPLSVSGDPPCGQEADRTELSESPKAAGTIVAPLPANHRYQ